MLRSRQDAGNSFLHILDNRYIDTRPDTVLLQRIYILYIYKLSKFMKNKGPRQNKTIHSQKNFPLQKLVGVGGSEPLSSKKRSSYKNCFSFKGGDPTPWPCYSGTFQKVSFLVLPMLVMQSWAKEFALKSFSFSFNLQRYPSLKLTCHIHALLLLYSYTVLTYNKNVFLKIISFQLTGLDKSFFFTSSARYFFWLSISPHTENQSLLDLSSYLNIFFVPQLTCVVFRGGCFC